MQSISDQTIYFWLRELGVARSQYHMSALCGRSPGWFSSTRCQGRQMPPSAMLAIMRHMEQQALHAPDMLSKARLQVVTASMQQECMRRAIRQWQQKVKS